MSFREPEFLCVAGMRFQRCIDGCYESGQHEGHVVVTKEENSMFHVQFWTDEECVVCEKLTEQCGYVSNVTMVI